MKLRNPGDWIVSAAVVLCSIVLLAALAIALSGTFLGRSSRTLQADFHDITGVGVNSEVRFAGAPAGLVTRVEILSPEARRQSPNPAAAVRLTMALGAAVPPLPDDIAASIASDTILSDKFVLLDGGNPLRPELPPGAIVAGIAPVTLDQFMRRADTLASSVEKLLGGAESPEGLFDELRGTLNDTRTLLTEARALVSAADTIIHDAGKLPGEVRPVLASFQSVAGEASTLLNDLEPPLLNALTKLESASASLDKLSRDGARLVGSTEPNLAALLTELRVAAQNAKIAATYARIFAAQISRRPSQLIWGTRRPPALPSKDEILSSSKPVPDPD